MRASAQRSGLAAGSNASRWLVDLLVGLAVVLAAGCGAHGRAAGAAATTAADAELVVAILDGGDAASLPEGVTPVGGLGGGVHAARPLVEATSRRLRALPAPWKVAVRLGDRAAFAKVRNPHVIVAAPGPAIEVFVRLTPAAAARDEAAIRAALAATGFVPATRSGDIVTGRAPFACLEALLRHAAVASLRVAGRVQQR